ncbi:RagB/SusD family nutrient uptake outer membrane protein [Albibacterium bauzanense]|uniref:Putative outer membrane starch-binding protein n=1 Tax=Albibacterium bauzanense TaxID=653929 RepID=A0A4R1LQU1_9SPHI|nr:RagB/SusD family nutrient uptake outer membrane protein [Albibacterium bauzanense]TCK80857.1 putative outer membrane starch-binding protein [Albibacterium bauzanense]
MKTQLSYKSKYFRWWMLASFMLIFSTCNVLDKEPLDVIPETIVWNDEKLVDSYLTGAYLNTTVLNNEADDVANSSKPFFSIFYVNNVSDESKSTSNFSGNAYQYKVNGLKINGGLLEYWERPYKVIRTLNEIIENLPSSTVSETFKKEKIAEARFLRAFNYFYMVKRYGGVPLITKVQQSTDPEEELYPKRNTEQEVYDFVISEAKEILNDLSQIDDSNWGRPSRYAALALISRAALYAGSIAEYGTVELGGVVGIERSQANRYYQESMKASSQIIGDNRFQLYDQNPDKTANFRELFLTKRNSEIIFAIQHDGSDKDYSGAGWSYDYFQCPFPNGWANGIHDAPYLEFAEAFEYIDGRPGTLDFESLKGKLITIDELWAGKDPRFLATVYTQDTKWQGRNLEFYNGVRKEDGTILTTGSYNGVLANGDQKVTQTGFGVLKYLDEKKDNGNSSTAGIFGSTQDFIVFRYAEILLNHAEAAYALGNEGGALDALNQVRRRAGIKELTSLNIEQVRNERRVELAFEGHRYWDLRRWRIAEDYLSRNQSGIRYILDYTSREFLVEKRLNVDGAVKPPIFESQHYYLPITLARTANNPNLVENPRYK